MAPRQGDGCEQKGQEGYWDRTRRTVRRTLGLGFRV